MSGFFDPEAQQKACEGWRDLTYWFVNGDRAFLDRAYHKAMPVCMGEKGGKDRLDALFRFLREGGRLDTLKGPSS